METTPFMGVFLHLYMLSNLAKEMLIVLSKEQFTLLWLGLLGLLILILALYLRKSGKEEIEVLVEKKEKTRKLIDMLKEELANLNIQLETLKNDLEITGKFNVTHSLRAKKYVNHLVILGEYIALFDNKELEKELFSFIEYTDATMDDLQKMEDTAYTEKIVHQENISKVTREFELVRESVDYKDKIKKQDLRNLLHTEQQALEDLSRAHLRARTQLNQRILKSQAILASILADLNTYKEVNIDQKKFHLKNLAYA